MDASRGLSFEGFLVLSFAVDQWGNIAGPADLPSNVAAWPAMREAHLNPSPLSNSTNVRAQHTEIDYSKKES